VNRSAPYRAGLGPGFKAIPRKSVILSIFIFICGISVAQETGQFTAFGFQQGFYFEGDRLDPCKTYYDSNAHVLFNPCFDFRNKGIYSSYLARRVILGDYPSGDSILVLLPHPVTDLDWKQVQENQKAAWDYYFRLWEKQDKLEKYYIDLEGTIRNFRPVKF
jgi:hypothetical protein